MTITIDLPSKTENELRKRARRNQQDLQAFLNQIIEREMSLPPVSFEDAVRPIHEWTESQGITEAEIEELVDETIAEVRRETPLSSR